MAVVVYVSIFPQSCLICVHMPISGLSFSIILLVQFYVHAQRPCLRVHRETTGVLKGVVECQRWTSNTLGSPQCRFFGLELLYFELVIARDQVLCEGAIFYFFLWEIVQDKPRSCRTW